jgi:hypothetical protein
MQDARLRHRTGQAFRRRCAGACPHGHTRQCHVPGNPASLQGLRDAGIPMREKFGEDILHFKMMLFHGQNMVHFSKANFDPFAYTPHDIDVNYEDEAVFFTGRR